MNHFLSFVNRLIPKRKMILFNSFPDLSGNALALYEYILKNRPDIVREYRLVWCIGSDIRACRETLTRRTGTTRHRLVKKRSLVGILCYFRARYIISTHGFFPFIRTAGKQIHLNVWHGMPFKKIGRMLEDVHTNGKRDEADMTISTSPLFRDIMARSFALEKERVLVTGQPCNDFLFDRGDVLHRFGIDRASFSKVLIWMPTYRQSVVGDIRQDGRADGFGVYEVLTEHFDELDQLLQVQGILLLIKPHPMDVINTIDFPKSRSMMTITDDELFGKHTQLYELLAGCDVLLTDYSSVFIDFLVTGKPIAFVCSDLQEYSATRGFCFEPPTEYMPGELIGNYRELVGYLQHMEPVNEKWREAYRSIQKAFHSYCDRDSSERLCSAVFGSPEP